MKDYKLVQIGTGKNGEIIVDEFPCHLPPRSIAVFMGQMIYNFMPEGMKVATTADLFRYDSSKGIVGLRQASARIGMHYLIESFLNPGIYEVGRCKAETTYDELKPWIEANKVFIKTPTTL